MMSGLRHPSFLPALLTVVLITICSQAPAAPRVALVIGNASYAHVPALANPLNDAADVGAALGRLGFEVTRLENADQSSLMTGLKEFALAASASEVALVFYAGHGIEVGQHNYLVPVDARLASDRDVEYEAVPLELVLRAVERASGLRLVVLDACRDNPFASRMQRAGATRSIGRGLARAEPPSDMMVAYGAKAGTVAADGDGRNSPYSEALLAHLEEPGLEVGLMFRKVRDSVLASTGGSQHPFTYGSLSGRKVYLAAAPTPVSGPSPASDPTVSSEIARISTDSHAARAYEAAERINTVLAFEAVVGRFPESIYADLARAQIGKLTKAGTQATGSGTAAGATAEASVTASSGAAQPASSAPMPAGPTPKEDGPAYAGREDNLYLLTKKTWKTRNGRWGIRLTIDGDRVDAILSHSTRAMLSQCRGKVDSAKKIVASCEIADSGGYGYVVGRLAGTFPDLTLQNAGPDDGVSFVFELDKEKGTDERAQGI